MDQEDLNIKDESIDISKSIIIGMTDISEIVNFVSGKICTTVTEDEERIYRNIILLCIRDFTVLQKQFMIAFKPTKQ